MPSVDWGSRTRLRWRPLRSKPGAAIALALVLVASRSGAQTGEPPPEPVSATESSSESVPGVLPAQPPTGAEVLVMPRPPTHGAPAWHYSQPDPKLWEWLKLESGEWLKGEITVLREDTLEFDSDNLDELELDWEDILEVRSPRINTYTFIGRRIAVGRGYVTENQITVATGAGMMNFKRSELLSIIPGEQREINLWTAKIGAGITVRGGNTVQNDVMVRGKITRRGAFARFLIDYRGNFGTVKDVENINNQKGDVRLDLFIWDRLFLSPVQVEFFSDLFQNVALRVSPGSGLGYEIVHSKRLEWSAEITALYRYTRFDSVEFPSPSTDSTFALGFGTHFDWEITSRIDLEGRYSVSVAIPNVEDTNQHAEAILSVELTEIFDLDTTFAWDHTGDPRPNSDGSVPLKDDYVLSLGVSIDF